MKTFFNACLLFVVNMIFVNGPKNASAQITPVIKWQNTIGGNDVDWLFNSNTTSDGGFILGGNSTSNASFDKSENSLGGSDYWIVKTDSVGNIEWENTIGGSLEDAPYDILQTSDGGYLAGGCSSSPISGDKTDSSQGTFDFWVMKIDAAGNLQWQKTIGGNFNDCIHSMLQTSDGGYILAGTSYSDISGDKTEANYGSSDYWVVKIDSLGNIQWQNTIGGDDSDQLNFIGQTADGGYILIGSSSSTLSGDKTENNIGIWTTSDYWIVKINSSGNIEWQNTIGGTGDDRPFSGMQTNDGGYIIGGLSDSELSGDKTEGSQGLEDYWIVKTDALGVIQWQKTIGGIDDDELFSIQQTIDSGYILGGKSSSGATGDKTEGNLGIADFWLLKTDASGNIQWQNAIGGNQQELGCKVFQMNDGEYALAGYTYSGISGDKTEISHGTDFWLVKLTTEYNYNSILGKLFIDDNSNSVQDVGEQSVHNKTLRETTTGNFVFSQSSGAYVLPVLNTGTFTVQSDPSINFFTPVPATHTATFSGFHLSDSLNDFALQPTSVINDLCIDITPISAFRPGFNARYLIHYENKGTTPQSPTIIFYPDANLSYVSASIVPNNITPDSVVWILGTLGVLQSGAFIVTVNVNTGVVIGTVLSSYVMITPIIGDDFPWCNLASWEVIATGSFDPNDILVDKDTLTTLEIANGQYLEYIIRFQNTGNDTAFNIKILNPIDSNRLQLNSIELIASSHPIDLQWRDWERNMEFKFDDVLLPDSIIDEPGSHGFVRYRIKPKISLSAGDSIKNNAAIYFDFNNPVLTNTAQTKIVLPTGNMQLESQNQVVVFPNPATDKLTIRMTTEVGNAMNKISIRDLSGRELKLVRQSESPLVLDVSGYENGIYLIQLTTEKTIFTEKVLVHRD